MVFVHGLNSKSTVWDPLIALVAEDDDLRPRTTNYVFRYASPRIRRPRVARPTLGVVAESLWTFLKNSVPSHESLFLVGHSQGGLIVTLLLEHLLAEDPPHDVKRIKGVVLYACPNQGSAYAYRLRRTFVRRHAQERSLRPLDPDIAKVQRRVINRTADSASPTHVPVLAVAGESDSVVSPTSAHGHWPQTAVVPGTHSTLIHPRTRGDQSYLVLQRWLLAALAKKSAGPSIFDYAAGGQAAQLPVGAGHEFVGRLTETDQIVQALRAPTEATLRAVAIHGKPGVGKSVLALHVANLLAPDFVDGQCYLDMRGLENFPLSPTDALGELLQCLGVPPDNLPPSLDARAGMYRSLVQHKKVLVVLDNARDEPQMRHLLPTGASAAVITSRAPLPGLAGVQEMALGLFAPSEGLILLKNLAGASRVDEESEAAASIVQDCGLLPLAVRIAGARLRSRPTQRVALFAQSLADERRRLDHLHAGDLDVRASFNLSYRELSPSSARAFRMVSLTFGPQITLTTAHALLHRAVDTINVEQALEGLVDAQLLDVATQSDSPQPLYRMHDLLRLFADEMLLLDETPEERETSLRQLLDYLASVFESAAECLFRVPAAGINPQDPASVDDAQRAALSIFDAYRDALLAQLPQLAAAGRWFELSRLVPPFLAYLLWRSDWSTLSNIERVCLDAVAVQDDNRSLQQSVWAALGSLRSIQNRLDEAEDYYLKDLEIADSSQDLAGRARVLGNLSIVRRKMGDEAGALAAAIESLDISKGLNDVSSIAGAQLKLGKVYGAFGHPAEALIHLGASAEMYRSIRDHRSEDLALLHVGIAAGALGNIDDAIAALEQSYVLVESFHDLPSQAEILLNLGTLLIDRGSGYKARKVLEASLQLFDELGYGDKGALTAYQIGIAHGVFRDWLGAVRALERAITRISGTSNENLLLMAQAKVEEARRHLPAG